MPIPVLLIGMAAVSSTVGLGKTVKAGIDDNNAKIINKSANELIENATKAINAQREACGNALNKLGELKMFILNSSINQFLESFRKLKNVDFRDVDGMDELARLHIDDKKFEELKELSNLAGYAAGGLVAGTAGGALAALGAYGAVQAFAAASTGTAIASLSGAAATNATLAWLGGGALSAGGLGMAGGAAVLGGLVAGPALMILGYFTGNSSAKNLEVAYTNRAEALKIAEEFHAGALQCEAIRRRAYVIYTLLSRLDSYLFPMIYRLEDIIKSEGEDYSLYSAESKALVASCASLAVSVKTVLEAPILTEDGTLTEYSETVALETKKTLAKLTGIG